MEIRKEYLTRGQAADRSSANSVKCASSIKSPTWTNGLSGACPTLLQRRESLAAEMTHDGLCGLVFPFVENTERSECRILVIRSGYARYNQKCVFYGKRNFRKLFFYGLFL